MQWVWTVEEFGHPDTSVNEQMLCPHCIREFLRSPSAGAYTAVCTLPEAWGKALAKIRNWRIVIGVSSAAEHPGG
ncbi:MAG: hypothetical protein D6747_06915 [Chlorobiota bacterium]|nr:MAG: hypothetical protein D6747_06915 [Chlorobiota bacterium]